MTKQTEMEKLIIWGTTMKSEDEYPLDRTEHNMVQSKFTEYLHKVMHRPGEVNTDS